jgi:hypothetical protein
MARSLVLGALFALSCSAGSPPTEERALRYEALVAFDDWRGVDREADPFLVAPDAVEACATPGFRVEAEQSWLEIDTNDCAWVTVTARARSGVELGQRLKLGLSHFDLDAPAPAEAELRLRLGDCDAWSTQIAIPSDANVMVDELDSPCELHQNDAVWFHLQNHGQNSYQLQTVTILR